MNLFHRVGFNPRSLGILRTLRNRRIHRDPLVLTVVSSWSISTNAMVVLDSIAIPAASSSSNVVSKSDVF